MAALALLFRGKRAPNPENDNSEESEVDYRLEKIHLLTLWRMQSQLQVLLPPPIY